MRIWEKMWGEKNQRKKMDKWEKSEFWGRKKKPLRKMGKILEKWWNLGKKTKCWKREGEKWEKRGKNEEKKTVREKRGKKNSWCVLRSLQRKKVKKSGKRLKMVKKRLKNGGKRLKKGGK